jgi:hypothetical protein
MSWIRGDYRPLKIIFSKQVGECGSIRLICPYCVFWCSGKKEEEEEMLLHVRDEHISFSTRHARFSNREVGDMANHHIRFPSMMGTYCQDSDLVQLMKECHYLSNTKKEVILFSISVEARERGIHLYFCGFCGEKTAPCRAAQIEHIFSEHIQTSVVITSARPLFTL